ncbi:MAG: hypothetical protein ACQER7_12775 [Bacteroidota bacterium]
MVKIVAPCLLGFAAQLGGDSLREAFGQYRRRADGSLPDHHNDTAQPGSAGNNHPVVGSGQKHGASPLAWVNLDLRYGLYASRD